MSELNDTSTVIASVARLESVGWQLRPVVFPIPWLPLATDR